LGEESAAKRNIYTGSRTEKVNEADDLEEIDGCLVSLYAV